MKNEKDFSVPEVLCAMHLLANEKILLWVKRMGLNVKVTYMMIGITISVHCMNLMQNIDPFSQMLHGNV